MQQLVGGSASPPTSLSQITEAVVSPPHCPSSSSCLHRLCLTPTHSLVHSRSLQNIQSVNLHPIESHICLLKAAFQIGSCIIKRKQNKCMKICINKHTGSFIFQKLVSFIKSFFFFLSLIVSIFKKKKRSVISHRNGVSERQSLVQKGNILTGLREIKERRGQGQTSAAEWGKGGEVELQSAFKM